MSVVLTPPDMRLPDNLGDSRTPRHRTGYHCVLAPTHHCRGLVTPTTRGKGIKSTASQESRTIADRHAAITFAKRLKRIFNMYIKACICFCGFSRNILERTLAHRKSQEQNALALSHIAVPNRALLYTLPLLAGKDSSIKSAMTHLTNSLVSDCSFRVSGMSTRTHKTADPIIPAIQALTASSAQSAFRHFRLHGYF